ncbi:MAG: hypothetical protein ABGZ53_27220 [Fuerstiella sp.]
MRSFFSIRVLAASVALAACLAAGAPTASAGSCHAPRCYYKTVTVYEYVRTPCIHYVTRYDHCGHPYRARLVTWKTVQVPVTKRVRVCY